MLSARQSGVSIIEIIVGLVLLSLLFFLGVPAFYSWTQNTQTRIAAEALQNGLQIARIEAVRRNAPVRFNLTSATGLVVWNIGCVTVTTDCPATIQSRSVSNGGTNARVGVSTVASSAQYGTALASGAGLPKGVTFNGLGNVPTANIGTDIARIDIVNSVNSNARRLIITIGTGGITRMCDPALTLSTNPQGCA